MFEPTYDEKVLETDDRRRIRRVSEPAGMPETPTLKLNGAVLAEGYRYTRAEGEITFLQGIAPNAVLEVFDGGTLEWRWSPLGGELALD